MTSIVFLGTIFLDNKLNPVDASNFPALHGEFLGLHKADAEKYYQMSYDPLHGKIAPYMYRILTPLLVSLLPIDHVIGFGIVNLLAIFLSCILFYFYLKRLDFNGYLSGIGVLLFLLSPGMIFTIDNICLTDAITFMFIIIAFYSILINNNTLYLFSLLIGMLNREAILITLPLYFLNNIDNIGLLGSLRSSIKITVIAAIEFIGIRKILGYGEFTNYLDRITGIVINVLANYTNNVNIFYIPYSAYWPFSTLWIMGLINIKYIGSHFLRNSLILLPFILSQIIMGADISRHAFLAFPIIIPLSLYIFNVKQEINKIAILILLSILFLVITIFIGIQYFNIYFLFIYNLQGFLITILLGYELIIRSFNCKDYFIENQKYFDRSS